MTVFGANTVKMVIFGGDTVNIWCEKDNTVNICHKMTILTSFEAHTVVLLSIFDTNTMSDYDRICNGD